jgi:hypothetical protein
MYRTVRSENDRAAWKAKHRGNDKPTGWRKVLIRRLERHNWRRGMWREWGEL